MDFVEILIKLIKRLNRNISRNESRAAQEKKAPPVSVPEKKEAKKVATNFQQQQKSKQAEKVSQHEREQPTQLKKQIKQARITIDETPGEMPAGAFGVSESIIGAEDETTDKEISDLIQEVKQIIQQETEKPEKPQKQEKSIEKIIRKAEQQPPEPFDERAEEIKELFEELRQKPKNEMIYFVMYDIENNRVRTKIAKYLEEKGLRRVQKSIFLGQTNRKEYQVIRTALTEIQESYENRDSIFIVPMPEDYLKSMYMIGEEVDFALTLHRSNTVFIWNNKYLLGKKFFILLINS